jgi:hypothetical protein
VNCFAGGIFFGTTFLHLIPESLEEIHKGIQLQYPIGEVVISMNKVTHEAIFGIGAISY